MTFAHQSSFLLRAAAVVCGLISASALPAATPDYFPLEVGNTWLYKAVTIVESPSAPLSVTYQSVKVVGTEKIGDRQYFNVSYFGRDVLLREESSTGNVFVYDRTAGAESPWVALSLPVGGTFPSGLDACSPEGQIVSRTDMVAVAVGDFADTVQVKFQNQCGNKGVIKQYYSPNVGLIRQEEATSSQFPLVYRLIYFTAGSLDAWRTGTGPEVSFMVAVDAAKYFSGGLLGARLTLRNTAFDPLNLHFPSGQSYDLKILNDKGETVFLWSAAATFAAVARDEKLAPGELTYGVTTKLDGFPAGRYVLQAYLTTDPILYQGQVAFEVVALPGR